MKLRAVFLATVSVLCGVVLASAQIQHTQPFNNSLTVKKTCQNHSDCNSHYNDLLNKTSFEYCNNNQCHCGAATVFENHTCLMSVGSPCGPEFPACERNSECRPLQRGSSQRCECIQGFFQNSDQKCVHGLGESCKNNADCDFYNQKLKCGAKGTCRCDSEDQIYDKESKQCKVRLRGSCQTASDERNVLRCLDGLSCITVNTICTMYVSNCTCMTEMRCLGGRGAACSLSKDSCVPGTFCESDRDGSVFKSERPVWVVWLIALFVFLVGGIIVAAWCETWQSNCFKYDPQGTEVDAQPKKSAMSMTTTV